MTWIGADFFSPGGASDTARSTTAWTQFTGPVHEQLPLLRRRVGRAVRHADDGPPADRRAVLAGDDQGAEQVDPVFEVVVLGVEVDADEVRVQVGRGHRQRCCSPCRGCSRGPGCRPCGRSGGSSWPGGPVRRAGGRPARWRRVCLTWASRPGAGTSSPGVPASSGAKSLSVARAWTVVTPARRRASFSVPVMYGQQREVFLLGAPLHAELVVQAAVALERQAVRDVLERGAGDPAGGGVLAQHEVVGRLDVGVRVGDDFQQGVVQAEDCLGGLPQRLDLGLLLGRRVGGRAEEDAGLDRLVGDAAVLEEPLQHEAVEGDLEAVFDLDLDGGLHVGDQDVQGAVRRAAPAAAGPRRPGAASRRARPPGGAGTGGPTRRA